jgi:hypothetical protein
MNNYGPAGMPSQGSAATGKPKWAGDKIPSGYKTAQLQQFTPEQLGLFQQMFGQVGPDSYLSRLAGGDEATFNQIEAPAMRQFQGLLGQAGSRFSGLAPGAMSARHGSGFNNSTGQIVSEFAQDLASRRQGLQRQAIQDLHGISQDLLGQRPYQRMLVQREQDPWIDLVGQLGGAIPGAAYGAYSGGASGASQGFQSGLNTSSQIARSFGGMG